MSTYVETIENHLVYTELTNLKNQLQSINDMPNIPPTDADALARISMVVENFSIALDTCDNNLIVVSWLNDAKNSLVNIKGSLANYKNSKSSSYLTNNAYSHLDSLLNITVKLNCVKSNKSLRTSTKSLNEYTKTIFANAEQSHIKVQELSVEIEALKKQIADSQKSAEKNTTDFQRSIDTEKKRLDSLSTSYQQQMNADQKTFNEMLCTLKESFSNAQDSRKKDFDLELEKLKTQEGQISQKADAQRTLIQQTSEQLIKKYDEKFNNYEKQVAKVIGVMDCNIFSNKYKEVANNAHKSAVLWHKIAIGLMGCIGIFAVITLVFQANSITNWTILVAKIFTTTTLVTAAAYAARQASKQDKVERYARQIEMELVAIDPFIASLDEERQSTIKEELAKKLFGNPNAMEMNSKEEPYVALENLTSANDFIKSLSEFIAKVK